ncbi:hypothetical protein [Lentzea sp. NPDC059081]|uniref:hypothetical protein n=1 Tax=Lentzea sp. NPDC059081 TaxID=3346719 RepID=UPI0036852D18
MAGGGPGAPERPVRRGHRDAVQPRHRRRARGRGLRRSGVRPSGSRRAGLVRAAARRSAGRIGHGTSCVRDPALLEHLAVKGIPLEVCPTSNVRTRQVPSIEAHPVRQMLDAGVVVTLNTVDPPFFGATLEGEYLAVAEVAGLGHADVARLAENDVLASFLPNPRKTVLLEEIAAVLAAV